MLAGLGRKAHLCTGSTELLGWALPEDYPMVQTVSLGRLTSRPCSPEDILILGCFKVSSSKYGHSAPSVIKGGLCIVLSFFTQGGWGGGRPT